MSYIPAKVTEVSLDVKSVERENGPDGPSNCSSSCCYYKDGPSW